MKKYAFILAIIAILPVSAATAAGAVNAGQPNPEVSIVNYDWFKNPPPPSNAFEQFNAANENFSLGYERYGLPSSFARQPNDSYSQGLSPGACPERGEKARTEEFIYRVRIRNSGLKTVKSVLWDYVFMDPDTGVELSRHTFRSERKVKSGETKTFTALSTAPPTWVIRVGMLARRESQAYREQIIIKGVEYADGTLWENNFESGAVQK